MKAEQSFKTGDIWLAAVVTVLLRIYPEFEVKNGRTFFIYPQDDAVYRAIADFNSGVAINIFEYTQTVKKLKSEMLTRREVVKSGGRTT